MRLLFLRYLPCPVLIALDIHLPEALSEELMEMLVTNCMPRPVGFAPFEQAANNFIVD